MDLSSDSFSFRSCSILIALKMMKSLDQIPTLSIFSHKGVILRPNDFLKNVQQRCQLVTRDAEAANMLASRVSTIHQIQHIVTTIGELIDLEFDLKTPKPSENLGIHGSLI